MVISFVDRGGIVVRHFKTFLPQQYNNINMTKHTFLLVIVCVLFEWNRICVNYLSFVYICIAVGITPKHFCACPKTGSEFPTSCVVVFLCSVKMRGDCSLC